MVPAGGERQLSLGEAKTVGYVLILGCLTLILASSLVCRGGALLSMMGLALTTTAGKPASRSRCGLRSLVVWCGPCLLLGGALVLQRDPWMAGWESWLLFGLAVASVLAYPIVAVLTPARGPHDRLAGTWIVPK